MEILNFLINNIFGSAPIFLALIAFVGLLLQKKPMSEILSGTFKTAIGVVILQKGCGILLEGIIPLATSIASINPTQTVAPSMGADIFMDQYGFEIGVAMLGGFLINLLVARFTKWKTVFLTGHMLYWFPFVFTGVGVAAGLSGGMLILTSSIFTALYYVVAPNIIRPYVKEVTGDDSFTLGHPSVSLALIGGFLAKKFGDKSKSTEDIKFPKSVSFLREISITGSIVIMLVYAVVTIILASMGIDYIAVYGLADASGLFNFIVISGITFGAGLTVLLLGVRMMIAEIVPAFTGFQETIIPNAIPAYDCPLLFPFAPNAVIIGFLISTVTSIITIVVTSSMGIFQYTVIPIVITCFFECGTATVVGNALGGRRGAYIAAAVSGVVMIFLMGFSLNFVDTTIADWMIGNGGQDFSLWAIIQGLLLGVFK